MPIESVPSRPRYRVPEPGTPRARQRNLSGNFFSPAILFAAALVVSFANAVAAGEPPLPEIRPEPPANTASPAVSLDLEPPPLPFEPDVTIANCQAALGDGVAEFTPVEPIREAIVCGNPNPIRLESFNAGETGLQPAATTNCNMAGALVRWLDQTVQPASRQYFGEPVTALRNASSYVCRSRNNVPGARLSEHATANALDVTAFQLASGRWIGVQEFWPGDGPESLFLNQIHAQACAEFTTVLGPNANARHRDHFHLDLGRHGRTGTYRVCE